MLVTLILPVNNVFQLPDSRHSKITAVGKGSFLGISENNLLLPQMTMKFINMMIVSLQLLHRPNCNPIAVEWEMRTV